MNRQIDCRTFKAHIDAYLDGELDEVTLEQMDQHAAVCPSCKEYLESMTSLLTMLGGMDDDLTVPEEVHNSWCNAINEEAQKVAETSFSRRRTGARVGKWIGAIAAVLVLLVGGTSLLSNMELGRSRYSYSPAAKYAYNSSDYYSEEAYDDGYYAYEEPEEAVSASYWDDSLYTAANGAQAYRMEADGEESSIVNSTVPAATQEATNQQVILRNATRKLDTYNFSQSYKSVQDLVAEYEGYFENSTVNGQSFAEGGSGRKADLTIRVPADDLDAFLASLEAVGTITFQSETAEDVSSQYYDTAGRLEGYRVQMERLNKLMEGSGDLEAMLMLEDKRTEVQYCIDSLEGKLRNWKGRALRSTVAITLTERQPKDAIKVSNPSLGDRIREAFYDSLNGLSAFGQGLLVFIVSAFPVLLILAVIAFVVIRIIRRRRKGK